MELSKIKSLVIKVNFGLFSEYFQIKFARLRRMMTMAMLSILKVSLQRLSQSQKHPQLSQMPSCPPLDSRPQLH